MAGRVRHASPPPHHSLTLDFPSEIAGLQVQGCVPMRRCCECAASEESSASSLAQLTGPPQKHATGDDVDGAVRRSVGCLGCCGDSCTHVLAAARERAPPGTSYAVVARKCSPSSVTFRQPCGSQICIVRVCLT